MKNRSQTEVDPTIASEAGKVDEVNLLFQTENLRIAETRKYCASSKKLGQEGNKKSAFGNRTRPTHIQNATPALLSVRIDGKTTQGGKVANLDNSPRSNSFLFSAIVPKIIRLERQPKASVVLMSEHLHFND